MASALRWGIIGPGSIARRFAADLRQSSAGQLVAIGTRDTGKPGLADAFPGARIHAGYDALLADPEVDVVYIATPHRAHAEWSIKAAEAGKHVLVEKPMAVNAADAEAAIAAARKAGTFMGEAFMYRLHPITQKIAELVTSGIIGEVRMIQSSFGLQMEEFRPVATCSTPRTSAAVVSSTSAATPCRWRDSLRASPQASRSSIPSRFAAMPALARRGSTNGRARC